MIIMTVTMNIIDIIEAIKLMKYFLLERAFAMVGEQPVEDKCQLEKGAVTLWP